MFVWRSACPPAAREGMASYGSLVFRRRECSAMMLVGAKYLRGGGWMEAKCVAAPKLMKPKRLIVNADDFGLSPAVTDGVLRAHRQGIVTSTTLMANMPGAADAVARLAEAPELGVGVHLNVCQGPPLSPAGRVFAAARDGVMERSAEQVLMDLTVRPWRLAAVAAEFEAQIAWALDVGLRPTHLDTHRHIHGYPPVFAIVVRLARRAAIPFVRRYGERLGGGGWPKASGKGRRIRLALNALSCVNGWLFSAASGPGPASTWGVEHTGRIDAAFLKRLARAVRPGVTELMTHPGDGSDPEALTVRLGQGARVAELAALCDPTVAAAFSAHGVELIHYGHLRTSQDH